MSPATRCQPRDKPGAGSDLSMMMSCVSGIGAARKHRDAWRRSTAARIFSHPPAPPAAPRACVVIVLVYKFRRGPGDHVTAPWARTARLALVGRAPNITALVLTAYSCRTHILPPPRADAETLAAAMRECVRVNARRVDEASAPTRLSPAITPTRRLKRNASRAVQVQCDALAIAFSSLRLSREGSTMPAWAPTARYDIQLSAGSIRRAWSPIFSHRKRSLRPSFRISRCFSRIVERHHQKRKYHKASPARAPPLSSSRCPPFIRVSAAGLASNPRARCHC